MYLVECIITDCMNLYNHPDPPFPDQFGGQPPFHCGRQSDPPRGPCSEWSMPDRRSKYLPPSRHYEPPVSHGGVFFLPHVVL
jgi:hypothetical protein